MRPLPIIRMTSLYYQCQYLFLSKNFIKQPIFTGCQQTSKNYFPWLSEIFPEFAQIFPPDLTLFPPLLAFFPRHSKFSLRHLTFLPRHSQFLLRHLTSPPRHLAFYFLFSQTKLPFPRFYISFRGSYKCLFAF